MSWAMPEPRIAIPSAVHFWLKVCVFLQMLVVVVGLGLSFWAIETILGSGPVLFLAGFMTAFLSYRRRFPLGSILGTSGPLFALLIFGLINILDWGPDDAKQPVPLIAVVYFIFSGFAAFALILQIRAREKGFDGI